MARPPLSIWSVSPQTFQAEAGIRLQGVHDVLGTHVRFHDHMNVIRSQVCRPEIPAAIRADFVESVEYRTTAILVKKMG
jgi:hypothetical protein